MDLTHLSASRFSDFLNAQPDSEIAALARGDRSLFVPLGFDRAVETGDLDDVSAGGFRLESFWCGDNDFLIYDRYQDLAPSPCVEVIDAADDGDPDTGNPTPDQLAAAISEFRVDLMDFFDPDLIVDFAANRLESLLTIKDLNDLEVCYAH